MLLITNNTQFFYENYDYGGIELLVITLILIELTWEELLLSNILKLEAFMLAEVTASSYFSFQCSISLFFYIFSDCNFVNFSFIYAFACLKYKFSFYNSSFYRLIASEFSF